MLIVFACECLSLSYVLVQRELQLMKQQQEVPRHWQPEGRGAKLCTTIAKAECIRQKKTTGPGKETDQERYRDRDSTEDCGGEGFVKGFICDILHINISKIKHESRLYFSWMISNITSMDS